MPTLILKIDLFIRGCPIRRNILQYIGAVNNYLIFQNEGF